MLIIGRAVVGRPFVLLVCITNYSSYSYNSISETISSSTRPPGRPLRKFINLSGVSLNKSPVVTKPFILHKYDRDVNQIKSLQEAESFYQNLKTRKSTYTYDTRSESTVRKTDTGHSSSTRRSPPDHEDSYKDRNDFFVKKKPYNSSNQSANQTLHTNENGTSSADLLSKKSGTRGINYSDRNFTYSDKKSRFFDPKKKNDFDKLPQDFEKDSRNIVRKNPEYSGEPPRYSDSKVKLFFDRNSRYSDDNSAEPNRRRRQSQYPKENRVASDEKNLPYEMKELPHVENQPPIDRIDIECTFHVNPEHPVASSVAVKLLRDNLKDHFGIENLSHMHLMILKEIKAGNHCFVKCPTGTGKSLMGLVGILETLHFSKNFKVLLIVPTVQLLLQYQNWVYALHPAIASRSQFLPMSEEPNSKGKGPEARFEDSVFFGCTPRAFLALTESQKEYLRANISLIYLDEADYLLQSLSAHPTDKELRLRGLHLPKAVSVLTHFMPSELTKMRQSSFPQLLIATATGNSRTKADLFHMGFFGRFHYEGKSLISLVPKKDPLPRSNSDSTEDEISSDQIISEIMNPRPVPAKAVSTSELASPDPPLPIATIKHYYHLIGRDPVTIIAIEDRINEVVKAYHAFGSPTTLVFHKPGGPATSYLDKLKESLGDHRVQYLGKYVKKVAIKNSSKKSRLNSPGMVYIGCTSDSRGLDCKDVRLVIILDHIDSTADYIHMAGRMGRLSPISSSPFQQQHSLAVISYLSQDEVLGVARLVAAAGYRLEAYKS